MGGVRLVAAALVVAAAATVLAGPGGEAAAARPQVPGDIAVVVVDTAGRPVLGARVRAAGREALTGTDGRVALDGTSGYRSAVVTVEHRLGTARATWTGAADRIRFTLGRPVRRALHVTGALPGTARWAELLDLADRTALNAVMLDVKDESGRVWPTTATPWATLAGAAVGAWDLATVADEVHARGLDLIVRVVSFQDPLAGRAIPSMAAWNLATGGPLARRGQVFLDPSDPAARAYAWNLADEACAAGVDEVQFDYVRFPDGATAGVRFDAGPPTGGVDEATRIETISTFLAEARRRTRASGATCDIAADVFGFVTSIPRDGGIGQRIEDVAAVVDVVSPMLYPNHWSRGWFGFADPADHPGEVIDRASRNALPRIGDARLRPWLQDFGGYGPAQVRAQIDAADALGLGWMIWNAASVFTTSALPTEAEVRTPSAPPPPTPETLPSTGFWDVAPGSTFAADIVWLRAEGITRGCNPPWRDEYCPDRTLTRAEAATFLVRALGLAPGRDRFVDDQGSTHEAAIDALAAAGITRGCNPPVGDRYCPDRALTRAEMASLLVRALGLAPGPDRFVDDQGSTHEAAIDALAAAGITRGCNPPVGDRYCPDEPVTRAQMAAFLHRALG